MRMPDAMDEGIDGPRTQMVVCCGGQATPGEMLSQRSMRRSRSSSRPSPFSIRYMMRSSQPDPSRHGVHCPHDSRAKNLVIRHAARTMQVAESITTIEPEPRRGDAAGDEGLERVGTADTSAEQGRVDEVAESGLHHLELVVARFADVPGQGEEPGPRRTAGAEG